MILPLQSGVGPKSTCGHVGFIVAFADLARHAVLDKEAGALVEGARHLLHDAIDPRRN